MPKQGIVGRFDEATFIPPAEGQEQALAAQLVDAAIPRIREHDGSPMFMFLHFMDPHHPYDAAGTDRKPFENYVREVDLCGEAIDRLIAAFKEAGLWDRTILIVSADHGEGFNKHGVPHHNAAVYEEILHVPLFVRVPGVQPRRVDQPVTIMDLGPTILNLYGISTPGPYMGESLLPFLHGKDPVLTRPIIATSMHESHVLYDFPLKVIKDGRKKSLEVYDLEADPDERKNLADTKGDALVQKLEGFVGTHKLE
jgi:arylsulfatase A-like enzyme